VQLAFAFGICICGGIGIIGCCCTLCEGIMYTDWGPIMLLDTIVFATMLLDAMNPCCITGAIWVGFIAIDGAIGTCIEFMCKEVFICKDELIWLMFIDELMGFIGMDGLMGIEAFMGPSGMWAVCIDCIICGVGICIANRPSICMPPPHTYIGCIP